VDCVPANGTYFYRVVATDALGNAATSEEEAVQVTLCPAAREPSFGPGSLRRAGADVRGTILPDPAAIQHRVYRGALGRFTSHRVSLGPDRQFHTADDVGDCAVKAGTFVDVGAAMDGGSWYYLVVGLDECLEAAPYGFGADSAGDPRPPGLVDCAP
jgi:hypothetical protein